MVTYKIHAFIMIVRVYLLQIKIMNYSSMVERSTHNGLVSVQFWVVQHIVIRHEHDVDSDKMLYRSVTHANSLNKRVIRWV